jgi:hypothetical protein
VGNTKIFSTRFNLLREQPKVLFWVLLGVSGISDRFGTVRHLFKSQNQETTSGGNGRHLKELIDIETA